MGYRGYRQLYIDLNKKVSVKFPILTAFSRNMFTNVYDCDTKMNSYTALLSALMPKTQIKKVKCNLSNKSKLGIMD